MDFDEENAAAISQRLKAHGEAFLRMFEGSGDEAEENKEPSANLRRNIVEPEISDEEKNITSSGRDSDEELEFPSGTSSQQRSRPNASQNGNLGLAMSLKKQRRLIMSGRSIHEQKTSSRVSRQDDGRRTDHEREITSQDFEKMRKEVDTLGASALGKRQRKDFENSMLRSVNARVQKSPRIPASIGQGLAKKRKQREDAAKELAIEAGMMQRKGLGKKRKQMEKAQRKGSKHKKRP
ncbi:hypothetical protein COCSUDRAFT_53249 [Coccomyxa subellipsoidea C-169]|uniref:Uncharacterized protein n=1 Tax=Coccomyxa subellipsoidea (strain C-169) TaxID=574566 RepID=I0Z0K3_COCSC|nr:hypothetical protein COCSUDRAFT_53249 [Coccomyxa subellipsoidea C-169]EIE24172.1 hypothetical protein COCSUDRAFT_53249 [Coccomyxa subellipsoidea C-169]|eukprot:XP_005648716.1 hypothetical protein COCSUDRAFT_53249 [Coccomyxa subellipsoidea C-169]